VLTAAREAQFAALAKRVAQAQQLAAHDEAVQQQQGQGRFAGDRLDRGGGGGGAAILQQQQQELRGWFEAGRRVKSLPEALGTRKHTSFFFFAAFLRYFLTKNNQLHRQALEINLKRSKGSPTKASFLYIYDMHRSGASANGVPAEHQPERLRRHCSWSRAVLTTV
jgi:hypothetical protein